MSRVGKKPITIPSAVKARVDGTRVFVEGPKGKLECGLGSGVSAVIEGGVLTVSCDDELNTQTKSNFGTARARINNMVKGVTDGWKRALEMTGVGYTATVQGQTLVLQVGFSHDVKIELPKEIKCSCVKTSIALESCDKDLLGVLAARIRKVRPPEPYLGKGIRYSDEVVRRKAGKTGKK